MAASLRSDESLDYADRWLRDGLQILRPALSVMQCTVDMTHGLERLEALRRAGVQATPTLLVVHAAAQALAANPTLHQVLAGNRRHWPNRVDIGLSVAGETFVAPVLVLEGADQKTIEELATEAVRRVPEVREADQRLLRVLRTWGWLVPFGWLRRGVLRALFSSPTFRRKGAGTFLVSAVPVDWGLTSVFATAGVLFAGQVSQRVVVVGGQPAVRPIMILTLCGDHAIWDGRAAARILATVKAVLERDDPAS